MPPVDENYLPHPIILELGPEASSHFFDVVEPASFPELKERFFNQPWAGEVGLGQLDVAERRTHFADFQALPQNLLRPLALRYHGHQFQNYNPNIGDGRGFLYAQLDHRASGRTLDLGTKGSGTTPYSRGGDGRLTLKGAVREVLATEMLESLGVNTSKSFAVFETGESLERFDEPSPTRGAVLTRLSHGHIRFGTFERLAFLGDKQGLAQLIEYCLHHYFPESVAATRSLVLEERAVFLLREVTRRSARLAAQWMMAGFVHGVLNTDNMNITGESFDYGPYRFLPVYDPEFTAAYFDETGLYAYGRQPASVLWNLEQLAGALSVAAPPGVLNEPLGEALGFFAEQFNSAVTTVFLERMGLVASADSQSASHANSQSGAPSESPPGAASEAQGDALLMAAFQFLASSRIGFAQFFHDWHGGILRAERRGMRSPAQSFYRGPDFDEFHAELQKFCATPAAVARLTDDLFQRLAPCTLLIDEIEEIWDSIARADDWSAFDQKVAEIRQMGRIYGRR